MKNNSMYFNEAPKKGDKTTINIRFTQERITDRDLDVQIEHFLRSREDSIETRLYSSVGRTIDS